MQIDDNELWILSFYRESELAGAMVMGRLAQRTEDDALRVHLTRHCAEEAEHARLWTDTILELGGTPRRVAETYQSRYYAELGRPATELEVLALTQVFERRVVRAFRDHLRRPGTHPAVARTLEWMITDEAGHIGWVRKHLERSAAELGDDVVHGMLRRFDALDRRVYTGFLAYRDRFGELVDPARREPAGTAASAASRDGIERRITEVVARSLGVAPEQLDAETSLGALGADSLTLVATLSAVEEAFRVEIPAANTRRLVTLGDLVDAVAGPYGPFSPDCHVSNEELPSSRLTMGR